MADIGEVLQERKGPLPVWAWGLAGVAGLGFLIYFVKRKNAGSASSASAGNAPPSGTAPLPPISGGGATSGIDLSSITGAIANLGKQSQDQNAGLIAALGQNQQATAGLLASNQQQTSHLLDTIGSSIATLGHGSNSGGNTPVPPPAVTPPPNPINPPVGPLPSSGQAIAVAQGLSMGYGALVPPQGGNPIINPSQYDVQRYTQQGWTYSPPFPTPGS
jgi:hypothetical protein